MLIPQQVYSEATKQPCLVYTIDTDERQALFGESGTQVRGRLQVDCYARTYAQVQTVAAAVRDALLDFTGLMQGNTSPLTSVRIHRFLLESENALMDEEPGLYRVMQRFIVWYNE